MIIIEITDIKKNGFSYKVIDQFSINSIRSVTIDLVQSLPKQDKLTEICKLCTEAGIHNIFPVITEYCTN